MRKVFEILAAVGSVVLNGIVVPILIEQYPETFKDNPWILPVSVLASAALAAPLLLDYLVPIFFGRIHRQFGKDRPMLAWILVVGIGAIAGAGLAASGYWLFLKHQRHLARQGGSRAQIESAAANISFDAYASNITYKKDTKVGDIEWMEGYIDVRVSIENMLESIIQNLNLTIRVLDDGGALFDMGQMGSNIPGVEFHAPELPEISIKLKGADGTDSTVSSRDMFAMASKGKKRPSMGNEYSLFCPRLLPKSLLRLVLATGSNRKGELTKALKIVGTYETMPSEGNKLIKIDKTIDVRH